MTEADWINCTDPTWMFDFLCAKPDPRKFRLFGCQCVRDALFVPGDVRLRRAVEVAEIIADGKAKDSDIAEAMSAMEAFSTEATNAWGYLAAAATAILQPDAVSGARSALENMVGFALEAFNDFDEPKCANSIRDIFGNPFRPVAVSSSWLGWNDGTVVRLAQGIYGDRAFDHLPILADALEEAGCNNTDILCHCRHPGHHVLGCWVVDVLTGRG